MLHKCSHLSLHLQIQCLPHIWRFCVLNEHPQASMFPPCSKSSIVSGVFSNHQCFTSVVDLIPCFVYKCNLCCGHKVVCLVTKESPSIMHTILVSCIPAPNTRLRQQSFELVKRTSRSGLRLSEKDVMRGLGDFGPLTNERAQCGG